jgi:hypothetical protein
MKLSPDGQLGQVVKREKVKTSIAGAQSWRIAYISSDAQERKTLSTALEGKGHIELTELFPHGNCG